MRSQAGRRQVLLTPTGSDPPRGAWLLNESTPFLRDAPRTLFFTGKGGVGKTSIACSSAIELARRGRRVLLVSTDPASNLDEVLGVALGTEPTPVAGVPGLSALNVDPEAAARAYRDRVVGPYRGALPAAAIASIEEQLSGACTVEIAAFDEFSKLLADRRTTEGFDHVLFDTAPTGHTLRLLALPSAWSSYLETSVGGTSCLGPLSGLGDNRSLYAASASALRASDTTRIVLVTRPEQSAITEAERTRVELAELGITNVSLVVNAVFASSVSGDAVALALERRGQRALRELPSGLAQLPRTELPLFASPLVGIARPTPSAPASPPARSAACREVSLETLVDEIARAGHGVVMTMGKGGVGKTTVAARAADALARRGLPVTFTTTDPAAHVAAAVIEPRPGLRVERIDPEIETERYRAEVLATSGASLDGAGRALLEEDLRSPCTTEIAVFRAFAETVARGEDGFVVIDTAPTGHTLLLLDAAETYHREVERRARGVPDAVRSLLPHLRDPAFTHVWIVSLPEATPVHEAAHLERDLARAGIRPAAWIVSQCLTPLEVTDPILRARRACEGRFLAEVSTHTRTLVVLPWEADRDPRPSEGTMDAREPA